MSESILETARLILRPVTTTDVESLYAIQGNRDAMRFTHAAESLEACTRWLRDYEELRPRLGFAPWAALAHALDTLGLPEVRAFVRPENRASIRVLEKAGFELVRFEPSLERNHYRISLEK